MAQAGIAGTRVIDCQPDLGPKPGKCGADGVVVIDALVLGQLDDHQPLGAGDDPRQLLLVLEHIRRDVHGQRDVRWEWRGSLDRGRQGGPLERQAKAQPARFGKADVRTNIVVEPCQCFDTNDRASVESDDRLEVDREPPARDQPPQADHRGARRLRVLDGRPKRGNDEIGRVDQVREAVRQGTGRRV